MKKQINPAAAEISFTVTCAIADLEYIGWDFGDDSAADQGYEVCIEVRGDETFWYYQKPGATSDKVETGDDKKTIEDVLLLLGNGKAQIESDYSADNDGAYVPSII